MNNIGVIIVAGGSGQRMGSNIPKQFLNIKGRPILMYTIERFFNYNPKIKIVVVLPENQIDYWKELCTKHSFSIEHKIIKGGATRFGSVQNGLSEITNCELIAIHDGVRPLVSKETIQRCFDDAAKYGNAIPVVPATESIRIADNDGTNKAIDRAMVKLVQTPQIFNKEILSKSHTQTYRPIFTDDASVAEFAGYKMHLTDGNRENIKITTPDDLLYAEALLNNNKIL